MVLIRFKNPLLDLAPSTWDRAGRWCRSPHKGNNHLLSDPLKLLMVHDNHWKMVLKVPKSGAFFSTSMDDFRECIPFPERIQVRAPPPLGRTFGTLSTAPCGAYAARREATEVNPAT